jgi:hypothetical protein
MSIVIIGVLVVWIPLPGIVTTKETTFTVGEGAAHQWEKTLKSGDRAEVFFTVRGESEDIRFNITDSQGDMIHNWGVVTGSHHFAFTAKHTGVYTFFFDNRNTTLTSKDVRLGIKTMPMIAYYLPIGLTIVGLVVVGIGLLLKPSEAQGE